MVVLFYFMYLIYTITIFIERKLQTEYFVDLLNKCDFICCRQLATRFPRKQYEVGLHMFTKCHA